MTDTPQPIEPATGDAIPKDPAPKDPAKARYAAITLIRMSGALFVMLGLLITERRIGLPWAVGMVLIVTGFFDVFVMPRILARRWKSPN